ncbi:MAG: PD40 domain-containing protein, partial [Phycisphaerales bacterium]
TIVYLLERFSRPRRLPAMAGILETKSQLKRRITMIAQFKKNSYQWSSLAVVLIIILACVSLTDAKRTKASGISATASRPAAPSHARDAQKTGLVMRELKFPYYRGIPELSLSWDGSRVAYTALVKHPNRKILVHNLVTGEETQITDSETGDAGHPVFSPDGKEIAYKTTGGIHIVSLHTGDDRLLGQPGFPCNWSRDGRFILAARGPSDKLTYSILSVSSSTLERLDLPLPDGTHDCQLSPDANYVSYSHKGSLYLYSVDDGDLIQITRGSTDDTQPIWYQDGKMLLFLSSRAFGPESDLCVVPLADGKATGGVRVIMPDFGEDIWLISLSQTGRLLYQHTYKDEHIYVAEIDPQTGQPIGETRRLVAGTYPVWSPDGKRIAYLKERSQLHIMSADGTDDQEIMEVNFPGTGTYAWAPYNDTIFIPEMHKNKVGIYAISVSTKERQPVLLSNESESIGSHVTCSPDGKQFAFIKYRRSYKRGPYLGGQIFIADVNGTNLRQLTFDDSSNKFYPAWSPDGKQIAFMSGFRGTIRSLTVLSVDDGEIKEVFRGKGFFRKSWSPDGNKIVWSTGGRLQIGHISTGEYSPINLNAPPGGLLCPCWSPDGRRLLFHTEGFQKMMIMDNFLPQANEAK